MIYMDEFIWIIGGDLNVFIIIYEDLWLLMGFIMIFIIIWTIWINGD